MIWGFQMQYAKYWEMFWTWKSHPVGQATALVIVADCEALGGGRFSQCRWVLKLMKFQWTWNKHQRSSDWNTKKTETLIIFWCTDILCFPLFFHPQFHTKWPICQALLSCTPCRWGLGWILALWNSPPFFFAWLHLYNLPGTCWNALSLQRAFERGTCVDYSTVSISKLSWSFSIRQLTNYHKLTISIYIIYIYIVILYI